MLKCKSRKVLRGYCCLLFNLEKTAIELSTLLFYKFALFFFFPLQMIKCKNIVKINFITRIEDIKKNCSKKYLCLSSKSIFLFCFFFLVFFFLRNYLQLFFKNLCLIFNFLSFFLLFISVIFSPCYAASVKQQCLVILSSFF